MSDDDVKIETGIPIPEERRYGRWPLRRMAVGDSFQIPHDASAHTMRGYVCAFGRRHGMRFTVRQYDGGIRVWRVA